MDEIIDILFEELDIKTLSTLSKQLDLQPCCYYWWCCKCCHDLKELLKEKRVHFDELMYALENSVKDNALRKQIIGRLGNETKLTLGKTTRPMKLESYNVDFNISKIYLC